MLDRDQVTRAIAALQKYDAQKPRGKGSKLFEDGPTNVILQFGLKTVPSPRRNATKIKLPHVLYTPEDTVCLFTKAEKKEATKLLEAKGVTGITKVIPITKLRKKYKSFEAKRQLSSMYDIFLTDIKIYHLLPVLLGKKFYEKNKFPLSINMNKSDLKSQVQAAITAVRIHIGWGSCITLSIGRVDFTCDQIVENVLLATEQVASKVASGNIQSVHVKTPHSIALPILNCLPPGPSVIDIAYQPSVVSKRKRSQDDDDEPAGDVDVSAQKEETLPVKKKIKRTKVSKLSTKRVRGSIVAKRTPTKKKTKR